MTTRGDVRRRRGARPLSVLLLALLGCWLLAVTGAGPAAAVAGEHISSYDVDLAVGGDGSLKVTETIDYDFGTDQRRGIIREIPTRVVYDRNHDRIYRLRDISVVSPTPGTPTQFSRSQRSGQTVLRIGDPNLTITGQHTYIVKYTVDGALNAFPDHVELFWNAVGLQWDVPIDAASAHVTGPAGVTQVTCFAGPERSTTPCGTATTEGRSATFAAPDGLAPFEALTVVVGYPRSAVETAGPILVERWSLRGALTPTPLTGSLGLGIVAVGGVGLAMLVGLVGRDRRFAGLTPGLLPATGQLVTDERAPVLRRGPVAVAFTPPPGLRPGQIGTLLDERANVIDVTATIIDLAVRGHLRIEELERPHWFSPRDWRLVHRAAPPGDELLPFEDELLAGLFESGEQVRLSELKKTFAARLAAVQTKLYEDVTAAGWFRGRPDKVRARWSALGLVVAAVGVALSWFLRHELHWAPVGVALVLVGLALSWFGRKMPARTAAGSAVLAQVQGFRQYIRTAEAEQLRFEDREQVFSRYLPYAIVFGEAERWVAIFGALAAAGTLTSSAGPGWYVGPSGWDMSHLDESLTGFTTGASSAFAPATPSSSGGSGFGGGGFSGGGGGGGGGSSW